MELRIPSISTRQMIEVDHLMIDEFGIQLIQMMENAGRNLAELSRQMLGGDVATKRIAVICGGGNNGGGGMAAARHLHNWGAEVLMTVLTPPKNLTGTPALQFQILQTMGIKNLYAQNLPGVDLVIDAMIGYGLTGNPRGIIADWIRFINAADHPILALDAPSGLDTTTGVPGDPCIHATATLTLALPKTGLTTSLASACVGDLYLADISVPPELYNKLGITLPPIFVHQSIVKLSKE